MNGISKGGILMKADYIFCNGPVITVDSRDSVREGVAIANGIIIKVGTQEDVMRLRGETTEMIDLKGRSRTGTSGDVDPSLCPYICA